MFRYSRRISLTLVLLIFGCAPHVPVPLPTPMGPHPDWGHVTKTSDCVVNGALPDPACTPGNINAALPKDVICGPNFRTSDYRDKATTPAEKATTYGTYNIPRPSQN